MRYIYIYSIYICIYIYMYIQYILCVCRISHPTSFRVCHVMPRHMAPQVPWLLDRPPAGGSPCLPRHARCRSIRGPSDRSSPGWGPPHLSNFVGDGGEKSPGGVFLGMAAQKKKIEKLDTWKYFCGNSIEATNQHPGNMCLSFWGSLYTVPMINLCLSGLPTGLVKMAWYTVPLSDLFDLVYPFGWLSIGPSNQK